MFCSKCGAELPEGAKFCTNCGAPVTPPTLEIPTTPPTPETPSTPVIPPTPPVPPTQPTSSNTDGAQTIRIFSLIMGIILGLSGLRIVPAVFGTLSAAVDFLFGGGLYACKTMLMYLFSGVLGLALLLNAAILILQYLRFRREHAEAFFFALAETVVLGLAALLLNVPIILWTAPRSELSTLTPIAVCLLIALAGDYLVLSLAKIPVMQNRTTDRLKTMLKESPIVVVQDLSEYLSERKMKKAQAGQAAQANGTTQPAGNMQNTAAAAGTPFLYADYDIIIYILLLFVTCGLYDLYFTYKVSKELNISCEGDGRKTAGPLEKILLSIITCGIYNIYWWYSVANRLAENAPRYGDSFQENGTTFLVWDLLGFVTCSICGWIAKHNVLKNINRLNSDYNRLISGAGV